MAVYLYFNRTISLPSMLHPSRLFPWHLLADIQVYRLKWRQPKRISAILDPKDGKQEAVHAQKHATPYKDSNLLCSGIRHAWYFESQGDGCKCKDAI